MNTLLSEYFIFNSKKVALQIPNKYLKALLEIPAGLFALWKFY
jgi:hypothetical protein